MTDFTIEIHPVCVQGQHKMDSIRGYSQSYHFPEGWTCTCKGFEYYGKCKHIREAEENRCTWNDMFDIKQEQNGICPRCGGKTISVKFAV